MYPRMLLTWMLGQTNLNFELFHMRLTKWAQSPKCLQNLVYHLSNPNN
jgi:hypothetical protein